MSTGRTCKAALKFPMVRDRGPPLEPDGLIYALRAAADLLNGINLIWPVQSCLQKYFASPVGQIISTNSRHPTPLEGRIAIVTDAGRDAVDAAAFCARWMAGLVDEACGGSPREQQTGGEAGRH